MKTQHTPGPWFIETRNRPNLYPSVEIRSTEKCCWNHPKFICDMPPETGEEPADFDKILRPSYYYNPKQSAENLANARLIASAPEMLDALQAVSDYLGEAGGLLRDQVLAAIAKAKGKAK